MNPNDKAMLEKVKPGWWATGRTKERWYLVVHVVDGRLYVWHEGHCQLQHISQPNITALHAPTDNPQMATAYLMGEPEEVTREEAEKMYGSGWTWGYVASVTKQHVIDCTGMLGNHATEICSPGGNVYKIRD